MSADSPPPPPVACPGGHLTGLGIDAVDVARLQRMLARRPGMIDRLFTASERDYAAGLSDAGPTYAGRFAAKEAVMKALGSGLGSFDWWDVEVVRLPSGQPLLRIGGRAEALAARRGVQSWQLSITHTAAVAVAVVAALS